MKDDDFLNSLINGAFDAMEPEDMGDTDDTGAITCSYSLAEYKDHAKLAYAFLTVYGSFREFNLLTDSDPGMKTFYGAEAPSYAEFEAEFKKSSMGWGIAAFDDRDVDRYGIFIVPGADPVLNIYCQVTEEDIECLMALIDQKYYDLEHGIERDEFGRPIK